MCPPPSHTAQIHFKNNLLIFFFLHASAPMCREWLYLTCTHCCTCKLGRLSLPDFHHHSPKTYDSALAGSNATLRLRDPTRSSVVGVRPSCEKTLYLRCVAQGADHEVSADWIAASSEGHKNPRPRSESLSSLLFCSAPGRE